MRLRAEVEVEWSGEEATLRDTLFSRTLRLRGAAADVVRGLESLEAPYPEELRMLLCLNLVDGAGEEVVERARQVFGGRAGIRRTILAETRFGCIGSGDCCQSYNFGPLRDEDVERLRALPLAETFGVGEWFYEREIAGEKFRFLSARDNRCVFLLDDCRCGIHAHFGVDAKPNLCRFYPYEQLATLDGVHVYDKGHCSEYSTTARSGPLLSDELPGLVRLLDGGPRLHHPVVVLDRQTPVDYGYFLPLVRRAVDELEAPPARAPEMLRAWFRRTRALKQALAGCPLSPGGPSAAVAELVARGPDLSPAADVRAGWEALCEVARDMAQLLVMPIAREHHERLELYSGRQAKELIPILHLVQEVAAGGSDYTREVAAVSAGDADADDVLRRSLRQALFGHDALIDDRPAPAQLRLAMVMVLALWGARVRALGDGRKAIQARDLDRGHMLATRMSSWASVQRLFADHEPETPAILEALPELVR
jgi:Fe-S-cluster containining protein